jgi:hypothetical protein
MMKSSGLFCASSDVSTASHFRPPRMVIALMRLGENPHETVAGSS